MTDEMLAWLWRRSMESAASAKAGSWRATSEALDAFSAQFGQGDVRLFRVPGRVNLIGEHTDYNHGYVMPMALDKDIVFVARPRADAIVNLRNVDPERFPSRNFAISAEIPRSPLGDWANYVKGAAQALRQATGRELCGADILASGQAPWGVPAAAGLSSSSALTVVAALTLAALNGIDLPKLALARLCSEAEWYVGTRGGIMDQFISILAERDRALLLDCRPRPGDLPGVSPEARLRHAPGATAGGLSGARLQQRGAPGEDQIALQRARGRMPDRRRSAQTALSRHHPPARCLGRGAGAVRCASAGAAGGRAPGADHARRAAVSGHAGRAARRDVRSTTA